MAASLEWLPTYPSGIKPNVVQGQEIASSWKTTHMWKVSFGFEPSLSINHSKSYQDSMVNESWTKYPLW